MANKATFSSEQQAERLGAALRCTYEVESIAMHLNDNLPTEPEYMFLRSLVLRIFDLNSVAMSALDKDQTRTTADMWGAINRGGHGACPMPIRCCSQGGVGAKKV